MHTSYIKFDYIMFTIALYCLFFAYVAIVFDYLLLSIYFMHSVCILLWCLLHSLIVQDHTFLHYFYIHKLHMLYNSHYFTGIPGVSNIDIIPYMYSTSYI